MLLLGTLILDSSRNQLHAGFTVIDAIHADIAVPYVAAAPGEAPRWDLHVHTGSSSDFVNYLPHEALLLANDSTLVIMPDVPVLFPIIGVVEGDPLYLLDQGQIPDQLYLGIEADYNFARTTSMQREDFLPWNPGGPSVPGAYQYVDVALVAMRGPPGGVFASFFFGDEPMVSVTTADGIDASDHWAQYVSSHAHYAWTFSQPGLYEIDIQARTFLADGSEWVSPVTTFYFAAGNAAVAPVPEPSSIVLLGLGGLVMAGIVAVRRHRS